MRESVTALVTRDSSRPRDGSGTGRVVSTTAVALPPFAANVFLQRGTDRLAARIAANAVAELDELALIGYPALDPTARATYETAIRLAARRVLEA